MISLSQTEVRQRQRHRSVKERPVPRQTQNSEEGCQQTDSSDSSQAHLSGSTRTPCLMLPTSLVRVLRSPAFWRTGLHTGARGRGVPDGAFEGAPADGVEDVLEVALSVVQDDADAEALEGAGVTVGEDEDDEDSDCVE